MRLILAAALGLVCAGAVQAGPLCRDSKGLFTPCPPGKTTGRRQGISATRPRTVANAEDGGSAKATGPSRASMRAKPAIIRKARLCRDSKGLFKPC